MRTLIYKRTHSGDPDSLGRFGCNDCMRRVRAFAYDAVIGVGGQGKEAIEEDLARKLTLIGIGSHKKIVTYYDYPIVTFDHFLYYGTEGELLEDYAPKLAKRLYTKKPRYIFDNFSAQEAEEITMLLALAENALPSKALKDMSSSHHHRGESKFTNCSKRIV